MKFVDDDDDDFGLAVEYLNLNFTSFLKVKMTVPELDPEQLLNLYVSSVHFCF